MTLNELLTLSQMFQLKFKLQNIYDKRKACHHFCTALHADTLKCYLLQISKFKWVHCFELLEIFENDICVHIFFPLITVMSNPTCVHLDLYIQLPLLVFYHCTVPWLLVLYYSCIFLLGSNCGHHMHVVNVLTLLLLA